MLVHLVDEYIETRITGNQKTAVVQSEENVSSELEEDRRVLSQKKFLSPGCFCDLS